MGSLYKGAVLFRDPKGDPDLENCPLEVSELGVPFFGTPILRAIALLAAYSGE